MVKKIEEKRKDAEEIYLIFLSDREKERKRKSGEDIYVRGNDGVRKLLFFALSCSIL